MKEETKLLKDLRESCFYSFTDEKYIQCINDPLKLYKKKRAIIEYHYPEFRSVWQHMSPEKRSKCKDCLIQETKPVALCNEKQCPLYKENQILYKDSKYKKEEEENAKKDVFIISNGKEVNLTKLF